MKPTFKQLHRRITHQGVKTLINLYNKLFNGNYDIHRFWRYNYDELADILDVIGYYGEPSYHLIIKFMHQLKIKSEEQKKKRDDELFNKMSSMKKEMKKKREQRKTYKQSIKNAAVAERELMNINYDTTTNKTENRRAYESSLNRAENKSYFKKCVKSFVKRLKRNESIEVDASNDEDLKLAFAEAIRSFKNNNLFGTEKHVYIILEVVR